MQDRSAHLRSFFARYVSEVAGVKTPRIERAFAAVPREPFAGPGPWSIGGRGGGYVTTPDDDPAFLYQDTLVALDATRHINIGQPSSHAFWLDAIGLRDGESVLQVGAGTGYYSAILAHLVGVNGHVHAFEIDPGLAARARENLRDLPQVSLHARSGIADDLPKVDAIYVCAGVTQPSWAWIDALRPGGRLLFPLQPEGGLGGMLLVTRADHGAWPAKFVSRAIFVACVAPQDAEAGDRLAAAFSGPWGDVKSFRIDDSPDETCWHRGDGWWLSTAAPDGAGSEPIEIR